MAWGDSLADRRALDKWLTDEPEWRREESGRFDEEDDPVFQEVEE
jgi:hypothetical protein